MTLKPTWTEESGPVRLRRQCSWCNAILAEGDPGAATSHGICPACLSAERQMLTERGDHEPVEVLARLELRNRVATMRDLERPALEPVDREWMDQIQEERRRLDWQAARDFMLWVIFGTIGAGVSIAAWVAL